MSPARMTVGTLALVASGLLLALEFMDHTYGIPFPMPHAWYLNQPVRGFVAIALIPLGIGLMKYRPSEPEGWQASRRGRRFQQVVIYTRDGCSLCELAFELLNGYRAYLPRITEVDIESDSWLRERFATTIPVVEFDGKIRFRGRINEVLLRRLIEGTPPIRSEPNLPHEGTVASPEGS